MRQITRATSQTLLSFIHSFVRSFMYNAAWRVTHTHVTELGAYNTNTSRIVLEAV